jgi:mannose-1-phosphate guanylyltransferase
VKAFLLAAGVGSRLRPVTDVVPKCMADIGGRPLLDIWLDALAGAGVDEVLVNLHHLPEVVHAHLANLTAPLVVSTVIEPNLLGSAGTLLANRDWVQGEDMFLACYADNLTDFDLAGLVCEHLKHQPVATVSAFRSSNPSAGGGMETDPAGWLTRFTEKPVRPVSDLVNAGMYAFAPKVLDEIDPVPPQDIGYGLLPRLVGKARVVEVEGYFTDIGTPDAYQRAQAEWPRRAPR